MKKIWMMLLLLGAVSLFAACSDDDDDPAPKNPVSEVKVPATAEIGTEITVTGTGFASTARFTFKNASDSVDVTESNVTASGATLVVPMSLTEGRYTLILKQDGEWELGSIELTPAALPIVGLEVPAGALTGQALVLGGSGYNESSKVYAVDAEGKRTELEVTDRSNGLTCAMSGVTPGKYSLVLAQNGGEWTLTEELEVVKGKRLVKVGFSNDYGEYGGVMEIATYEVSYEDNLPKFLIYGDLVKYSVDQTDGQVSLTLATTDESILEGYFYYGYMKNVALTLENGMAQHSTITYYNWSKDKTWNFDWTYEGEYMKTYEEREYGFEEMNLTSINDDSYDYQDGQDYTRPGMDVAACIYEFVSLNTDMGWFYAAMTGMLGEKSSKLPVSMTIQGYDENFNPTPVVKELTYSFDEDGYVTRVAFSDIQSIPCWVDFTYEDLD